MIQEKIKTKTNRKRIPPKVVGSYVRNNKIYCFFSTSSDGVSSAESSNAIDFHVSDKQLAMNNCKRVHISKSDIGHFAVREMKRGGLAIDVSSDLDHWKKLCVIRGKGYTNGVIVSNYHFDNKYLMYLGGKDISYTTSINGKEWNQNKVIVHDLKIHKSYRVEIDLVECLPRGILLCYRIIRNGGRTANHKVYLALLNKEFPEQVLWKSEEPIWENNPHFNEVGVGGSFIYRSQLFGFWNSITRGISLVRYPVEGIPFELPKDHLLSLKRIRTNPIIYPRDNFHWESFATYNPAAFQADGKVHILYRAQGHDLMSSIGYANSTDGIHIHERLEKPVYYPQEVFESYSADSTPQALNKFMSGGGIAGCEDPRATVIEDKLYMTYVAFDGARPPRVALTSIRLDDFLAKRWLWERPVLISPPGVVDKSAVIFPEKIRGQYVIMHRIFPNILIDYESSLDFDGTRWLKGQYHIPIREGMWDSRKIGAGAPPLKTSEGWLLIYYGVDDRDDRQYKMGAMLLDLNDPTKVLYRSSTPILEPSDWYENSGFKPGVVYPCGAVIQNNMLLVYYGGADCVVCVASADLDNFIDALKSNHEFRLTSPRIRKVQKYATDSLYAKPNYIS